MRKHNKLISTCILSALTGVILLTINPTTEVGRVVAEPVTVEMATVGKIDLPTTEEVEIEVGETNTVESTYQEITTETPVPVATTEATPYVSVEYTGGWSEYDIYLIQCVVETETYGADFESKTHIASVIMNRVYSDRFPNSPAGVVTAPSQFVYFRTNISQDTIDAVNHVLTNGDTVQGAIFFHSGGFSESFSGASYLFTDSVGHHFYR